MADKAVIMVWLVYVFLSVTRTVNSQENVTCSVKAAQKCDPPFLASYGSDLAGFCSAADTAVGCYAEEVKNSCDYMEGLILAEDIKREMILRFGPGSPSDCDLGNASLPEYAVDPCKGNITFCFSFLTSAEIPDSSGVVDPSFACFFFDAFERCVSQELGACSADIKAIVQNQTNLETTKFNGPTYDCKNRAAEVAMAGCIESVARNTQQPRDNLCRSYNETLTSCVAEALELSLNDTQRKKVQRDFNEFVIRSRLLQEPHYCQYTTACSGVFDQCNVTQSRLQGVTTGPCALQSVYDSCLESSLEAPSCRVGDLRSQTIQLVDDLKQNLDQQFSCSSTGPQVNPQSTCFPGVFECGKQLQTSLANTNISLTEACGIYKTFRDCIGSDNQQSVCNASELYDVKYYTDNATIMFNSHPYFCSEKITPVNCTVRAEEKCLPPVNAAVEQNNQQAFCTAVDNLLSCYANEVNSSCGLVEETVFFGNAYSQIFETFGPDTTDNCSLSNADLPEFAFDECKDSLAFCFSFLADAETPDEFGRVEILTSCFYHKSFEECINQELSLCPADVQTAVREEVAKASEKFNGPDFDCKTRAADVHMEECKNSVALNIENERDLLCQAYNTAASVCVPAALELSVSDRQRKKLQRDFTDFTVKARVLQSPLFCQYPNACQGVFEQCNITEALTPGIVSEPCDLLVVYEECLEKALVSPQCFSTELSTTLHSHVADSKAKLNASYFCTSGAEQPTTNTSPIPSTTKVVKTPTTTKTEPKPSTTTKTEPKPTTATTVPKPTTPQSTTTTVLTAAATYKPTPSTSIKKDKGHYPNDQPSSKSTTTTTTTTATTSTTSSPTPATINSATTLLQPTNSTPILTTESELKSTGSGPGETSSTEESLVVTAPGPSNTGTLRPGVGANKSGSAAPRLTSLGWWIVWGLSAVVCTIF